MISQDFQKQVTGYGLTTAQILYRRPDHPWLPLPMSGRPMISAPNFPAAGLSAILAEIARRCPAFGHGRAFPPYQTGRDQTGGRAVPAALISDRLHSRELFCSDFRRTKA